MDPYHPAQSAQTDPGRYIPSHVDRVTNPETENPQEAKRVYPGKPARHT